MSKYNKLPKAPEKNTVSPPKKKASVSALCCLPIFMADNPAYKDQLNQIMGLEELMPKTRRLEIYQMMYMDKLLEQLREYDPDVEETAFDPFNILSKNQDEKSTAQTNDMMKAVMEYQSKKDPSSLFGAMMPGNPMMSMLMPMMMNGMGKKDGDNKDSASGGMMESLLPMMMSGMGGGKSGGGMMESLLPMMMSGMGGGGKSGGGMMESLLPMMMGGMGGGGKSGGGMMESLLPMMMGGMGGGGKGGGGMMESLLPMMMGGMGGNSDMLSSMLSGMMKP